jgi:hypothetical protein
MNYNTLIVVASWEDRFELGIRRFLTDNSFQRVILLSYEEYTDITNNNVNNVVKCLSEKGIDKEIMVLRHKNSVDNWNTIKSLIDKLSGSVVIDISTMPRDIIYTLFLLADQSEAISCLYCFYNSPESYTKEEWLTKDPSKPQLIFNMSGVYEMDKGTVLIIVTGFDKKRVEQLLNYYEPRKVYLGLQIGNQYKNDILNIQQYTDSFKSFLDIEYFSIDAYSKDYGYSVIEEIIIKEGMLSNIIVSSLGPKPSSIAIYRLYKRYQNIGLIYVPVISYNEKYSSGLSKNGPVFEQIK